MTRRSFVPHLLAAGLWPLPARSAEAPPLPSLRIAEEGWGGARLDNLQAVFQSTARVFCGYFPERKIEPIFITRTFTGPMVHFERNYRREIVMDLDSEGNLWCQFVYQFAHEFCHVLAGFDQDGTSNLWFEESLCEAASLFALRNLAQQWRTAPPYPNWKSYVSSLETYAQMVIKSRERIGNGRLPEFYLQHAAELRNQPTNRALNGAISLVLLKMLEQSPASWEAVSWLNSSPSAPGESFAYYLHKWLRAAPAKHQAFIAEILGAFEVR